MSCRSLSDDYDSGLNQAPRFRRLSSSKHYLGLQPCTENCLTYNVCERQPNVSCIVDLSGTLKEESPSSLPVSYGRTPGQS